MKLSKKALLLLLVGGGGILLTGMVCVGQYDTLVRHEEGILAQEKNIDLAIDKMEKKIKGQGYVVKDFKATLLETLAATVGEGGRSAGSFFNAVAENYKDVPESVWRDLSATMNAEYESLASSQGSKVSRIQAYRTDLRSPVYAPIRMIGGFPTIDLDKHDKLILGGTAREARETGELEGVNPFGDEKP